MDTSLEHFFSGIARDFLSGDVSELALVYSHPLAVFLNGEIKIESSPEATRASIMRRRQLVRDAGVTEIVATIEEVGDTTLERFPVRVNWSYRDASGTEVALNRLRYYCSRDDAGDLRIEILEFISTTI